MESLLRRRLRVFDATQNPEVTVFIDDFAQCRNSHVSPCRGRNRGLPVHPGGPFWRRRDFGTWSIPKGERHPGETAEEAARREFGEELGTVIEGSLAPLGCIRQRSGKVVEAFAIEGDLDTERIRCGSEVKMEWPRGSGRIHRFPEIDRAAWFTLPEARLRILAAQGEFIERLEKRLLGETPHPIDR